jgi:prolyl-tRNA editing enzyme YbaK/EbsC (Cys-tRNA(Pro) deacylase)
MYKKKGAMHMSYEEVREYFKKQGLEDRIQVLNESTATVALAAEALHINPASIAKTLSFMVGGKPILVVMEGSARVDNHLYREFFHVKAKMMTYAQLQEYVGHEPGGVCPFAVNEGVDIFLDESLKKHATVYPACGSDNTVIKLTLEELKKYSGFKEWVHVTKESAE